MSRALKGLLVALTLSTGLVSVPALAEPLGIEADLPRMSCAPGGPTPEDAALATQLNSRLTNKMRGHLTNYEISCARAVVKHTYDRGLNTRAAQIAVATVIVETSLRNYDGGHSSSVGLFQQLQSWGTREQRLDPKWSTNAFLGAMEKTYPGGRWNKLPVGEVAQGVQRSAHPTRYQPEAADAQRIVDALGQPGETSVNVPANRAVYEPSTATTEFFARGERGEMVHVWNTDGQWSPWETHQPGFHIKGNPVSVYDTATQTTEVFARDSADRLVHTWHARGAGWSNWEVIGDVALKGDPAATYDAATRTVEVFARDTADRLVHAWHEPGKGWSGLEALHPDWRLASDPAPVFDPATATTEVFARGTDGTLIHTWHPPGKGWAAFEVLPGGTIQGTPFPVYEAHSRTVEVFARDTADRLVHAWHPPGKGWAGLEAVPGDWRLASDPVAVYDPSTTTTEVFARGAQDELMHVWHQKGAGWSNWEVLHSTWKFNGKPVAVYEPNTRTVEVFARGSKGELMHVWHTFGDGWSDWARIGDWTIAE
ncbi:hypothetical protein JOF53_001069 [Crossiella equi]|uniref:PLL-like beta propeller domain-containing protein n=1 Tax=Crossiella equi TaxID=130796 RepID=A0ABS5A7E9_9PSEU|nr:hypothetical protein [Crossiella equi]MBP2472197.1 hypothetical protein [Crossiella equi]